MCFLQSLKKFCIRNSLQKLKEYLPNILRLILVLVWIPKCLPSCLHDWTYLDKNLPKAYKSQFRMWMRRLPLLGSDGMSSVSNEDNTAAGGGQYHVYLWLELYLALVRYSKMRKQYCQYEVVQMSQPEHFGFYNWPGNKKTVVQYKIHDGVLGKQHHSLTTKLSNASAKSIACEHRNKIQQHWTMKSAQDFIWDGLVRNFWNHRHNIKCKKLLS